jgi:exodeoxyribonuclease-3
MSRLPGRPSNITVRHDRHDAGRRAALDNTCAFAPAVGAVSPHSFGDRVCQQPVRDAGMRLLTWNIRAGGGTRLPRIATAIAVHQADVLVLTEYRSGEAGKRLRAILRDQGYGWQSPVEPPGIRNGVLIASREKPTVAAHVAEHVPEPWRMLAVTIGRIRLFGIYMPNLRAKIPYWEALIEASGSHAEGRALAMGDFNTCRAYVDEPGATDVTALFLDKILGAGFRDVWRDRFPDGREYSWYSHRGNGFRIDHAFASARLARGIGDIRYSHAERTSGLSDHSVLIVDVMRKRKTPRNEPTGLVPALAPGFPAAHIGGGGEV